MPSPPFLRVSASGVLSDVNLSTERDGLTSRENTEELSSEHTPAEDHRHSKEFPTDTRLRPLHEGIVGRDTIVFASISMILPLLFGLAFALGHHFYYQHLDGKLVDVENKRSILNQEWVSRIGTAFLFLTKTSFVASISTAFCQQVWVTVNKKYMRLSGLDALWAVLSDPVRFASLDMLMHAKVATLLALAAWLVPLACIPSTGSIGVTTQSTSGQSPCMIRSIDLSNSTAMPAEFYSQHGNFGEYSGSTPAIESVAAQILTGGSYITWPSPCGSNCVYNTSFSSPVYQCSDPQTDGGAEHVLKWQCSSAAGSTQDTLTILWAPDNTGTMMKTECVPYNATYSITVRYVNGSQSVQITGLVPHDPIHTPTIAEDHSFGDGLENLVGVKGAFAKGLEGYVRDGPQSGYFVNGTLAGYSKMANVTGVAFFHDVPALVEDYMRNLSISLMATAPPPPLSSATCHSTGNVNVYQYHPTALMAGYGASLLAALLSAFVGMRALLYLGGGGGRTFSLVLSTTRNRELDRLFHAQGRQAASHMSKSRFKYGVVRDEDGGPHLAFTQEPNSTG